MENQFELIEGYCEGTLSPQDQKKVENLMEFDENFRKKVQLHQLSNELVLEKNLLDLKKELADVMDENSGFRWTKSFTIASVILAITSIIGIFLFYTKTEEILKIDSISVQTPSPLKNPPIPEAPVVPEKKSTNKLLIEDGKNQNNQKEIVTNSDKKNDQIQVENYESKDQLKDEQPISPIKDMNNPHTDQSSISKNSNSFENTNPEPEEPCNYSFDINIEKVNSCEGESNGSVKLIPKSGKGFQYAINDQDYTPSSLIENLAPGEHSISVKDNNSCIKSFKVLIETKFCLKDETIIPSRGDVWKLPSSPQEGLKVSIYNKAGQRVYYTKVNKGENKEWYGKASDGSDLPMGGYTVIVEFDNGTIEKAIISIIL